MRKVRSYSASQYRLRKIRLSDAIAEFLEEYDPYEFRDNLMTGETIGEGLTRVSKEILRDLDDRIFDQLIDIMEQFDDDMPSELEGTYRYIMHELRALNDSNPELISKNILRIRRRK